MVAALLTFAAEEPSKTAFYICGGSLAAFAVIVALVGIRRHETFPATAAATRALIGVFLALVAASMATAVITA